MADTMPVVDDPVTVNVITVKMESVRCPACDESIDGWFSGTDPRTRDTIHECDYCSAKFKIAPNAEIRF